MEEGAFDDLPYQGERLPIEDDSAAGEWALAHRMLRNAGAAPPWIESDKEVRRLLARRDALLERARRTSSAGRARERAELTALVEAINRAIARVNAEAPTDRQHRRPLDLDTRAAPRPRARRRNPVVRSRTAPRPPRAKASVWRSTSASVVTGDISAMLWNGVISTPPVHRPEVEEPLEVGVGVGRTARRRSAAASA